MTEYDDVEMVAEECFEITGKLLDPDYNVRVNEYGNGFNIIEPAKRLFDAAHQSRNSDVIEAAVVMAHQLLLRLVAESRTSMRSRWASSLVSTGSLKC